MLYLVDLHNSLSVTNALLAKETLLLTSFCVPPCIDTTTHRYVKALTRLLFLLCKRIALVQCILLPD